MFVPALFDLPAAINLIVLHELIAVELVVVKHLFPVSMLLKRDVCLFVLVVAN